MVSRWLLALTTVVALGFPAPARAEGAREVTLLYTGFTGGLSSNSVNFEELHPLFEPETKRDFQVGTYLSDNVFAQGPWLLFTEQGPLTLEDFQAFFAEGPVEVRPAGEMSLLASDYAYVFASNGTPAPWPVDWLLDAYKTTHRFPDARKATAQRFQVLNRSGLRLQALSLTGEPPSAAALERPSAWEMLAASQVQLHRTGDRLPLLAVSRPLGDGLRRAELLHRLRQEHTGHALTVDVGNLLDPGFSELSLRQREFTMLQLAHLGYDALVPGETELSLPPADWERVRKAVPLLAANLTPQRPELAPLPGTMIKEINGLKIALIGLVDDRTLVRNGLCGPKAAWKVTDPLQAAREAVAALQPERPDATFVLTNISDDRLTDLRLMDGATAVVADFMGLPGEVFSQSVELQGAARRRTRNPYMVAHSSRNRVGLLSARFADREGDRPELKRLDSLAHLVTDHLPSDVAWRHQLNLTLDRYQKERRHLLLPDLRDVLAAHPTITLQEGALPWVDDHRWSRMVAQIMRRSTGAEVAIGRLLPQKTRTLGPINQLTLEGWLDTGDRLVQLTLPGKTLKALAARDQSHGLLNFAGYDPVAQKVLGVAIADDELYRVTTTDLMARHALFEDLFANRELTERWLLAAHGPDQPAPALAQPYREGERAALRDLVLSYLKGLKSIHGASFDAAYLNDYARLLAEPAEATEPRWTVTLDDGSLLLNSYQARGNEAFSQVRNTRVTTPSSFAVGGKGRLATLYDSRQLAWENRIKAIYKRATLTKDGQEVTQETDDEIVTTTELRLKVFQGPVVPFVNSNYTTEFKPDEANGVTKPRRQELNAMSGLVVTPGFGFKELRAGAVLKNDLANPGFLEPGLMAQIAFEKKLEPFFPATFKSGLDVTHYFATPTDTPDRLGLLADLTASLTIPIWERFNLSVSADYFLFRGKVPQTMQLGSSLDFKVGIGYAIAFKPFYGVWF